MTAHARFNLFSCAVYVLILALTNVVYFVAYGGGHYPSCGTISIIFLNIAVLSLFLPVALSGQGDEKNQRSALKYLCIAYLVIEVIVAWWLLRADSTSLHAGLSQGILCGVFLICLFGVARSSAASNAAMEKARVSRSLPLLEATANLRIALSEAQSATQKEALREALAVIQSTPLAWAPGLDVIDSQISAAASTLVNEPSATNSGTLCRLLRRRQTMLSLIQQ